MAASGLEVILAAAVLPACVCRAGKETLVEKPEAGESGPAAKIFQKSEDMLPETSALFNAEPADKPLMDECPLLRERYALAHEQNPDVIGRISMDAAGIDYIVAQGTDNLHYLTTNLQGKKSKSGAIFLDYRCDIESLPKRGHYIMYGHNMKNGSMFHNLIKYKKEEFFRNNRIFRFDTLYADYRWEIFSAYVTDTHFYFIETEFKNEPEWLSFLKKIKEKSLYKTDALISGDDVVLTLCTCSYEFDGARFVLHARLINESIVDTGLRRERAGHIAEK